MSIWECLGCGQIYSDLTECNRCGCEEKQDAKSALEKQHGGSHYSKYTIQPIEFISKNNLTFAQGCAIKYICRYKDKNGLEDLKKAKHFLEMIAELEYGEKI